jgi:hypothetical protein
LIGPTFLSIQYMISRRAKETYFYPQDSWKKLYIFELSLC